MSEDHGLISKIIKGYNDTHNKIAKHVIDRLSHIGEEVTFLDDGFIATKINQLKTEHHEVSEGIRLLASYDQKKDDYYLGKMTDYLLRKRSIEEQLVFYGSNSFQNIDNCIKMGEQIKNFDFLACLYGLKSYHEGDQEGAIVHFERFFQANPNVLPEHYLVCKVYGCLLYEQGRFQFAEYLHSKSR